MTYRLLLALGCAMLPAAQAWGQDHDHAMQLGGMPMDMPGMENESHPPVHKMDSGAAPKPVEGSGTSRLPASDEAIPGIHAMSGNWMLMAHGTASLQYTDHSGPRGDDKVYVTSMAMLMAERETSWGHLQFKSMFSLEPAMDPSGYPNLFATGETAHGLPIVDRQHPHDLFMELAARVDINAGSGSLFLYGGPVGEPALGPSAFGHRASAQCNPEPPITHHWFDSTHITYGVVTAGYASPSWQVEASAFRGQEPDERRWNIETPWLDSWSVRATLERFPFILVRSRMS